MHMNRWNHGWYCHGLLITRTFEPVCEMNKTVRKIARKSFFIALLLVASHRDHPDISREHNVNGKKQIVFPINLF